MVTVGGQDEQATVRPMIAAVQQGAGCRAGTGTHLLGSCHFATPHAEVNPWRLLDGQCPRVVATVSREPATETALEDA